MPKRHRGLGEDPAEFHPKDFPQLHEVRSSVAKTHLPQLLDEVERGATIVITRYGLTVYDAAYLELALREGIDLATLDAELADAARAEGVSLIG